MKVAEHAVTGGPTGTDREHTCARCTRGPVQKDTDGLPLDVWRFCLWLLKFPKVSELDDRAPHKKMCRDAIIRCHGASWSFESHYEGVSCGPQCPCCRARGLVDDSPTTIANSCPVCDLSVNRDNSIHARRIKNPRPTPVPVAGSEAGDAACDDE